MSGGQDMPSAGSPQAKPVGGTVTNAGATPMNRKTGAGPLPAGAAAAVSGLPAKPVRQEALSPSVGIAWENVITGWPVRLVLALITLAIWAWIIAVPFPQTESVTVVSARDELNTVRENIAHQSTYASVDEIQLSNLVIRAQEYLIPKRERIVALTASMEKFAREQGLLADIVIKPVPEKESPAPGVRVFVGTLRLTPTTTRENSPFERLLGFLDRLEGITEKVEVTGLTAMGEKGRMGSAQVELQFWIKHEKSAAQ